MIFVLLFRVNFSDSTKKKIFQTTERWRERGLEEDVYHDHLQGQSVRSLIIS